MQKNIPKLSDAEIKNLKTGTSISKEKSPKSTNVMMFKNSKEMIENMKSKDSFRLNKNIKHDQHELVKSSPKSSIHNNSKLDLNVKNKAISSESSVLNTKLSVPEGSNDEDTEKSQFKNDNYTQFKTTPNFDLENNGFLVVKPKNSQIKSNFDKGSIAGEKAGKLENLSKIHDSANINNMNEDSNLPEDSLFKKNVNNQSENPLNFSVSHKDHFEYKADKIYNDNYSIIHIKLESIILHCELFKFSPSTGHQATHFPKYCILTCKEFRYYKSQESYFTQSNPIFRINLSNINKCVILKNEKLPKGKKNEYHYFCLKLNEIREKDCNLIIVNKHNTLKNNDEGLEINKKNIDSERNHEKKPKTISLLEVQDKKSNVSMINKLKTNQNMNSENDQLIFGSNNEKVISLWMKNINDLLIK